MVVTNETPWSCGVLNCGGGKCVHRLTEKPCPMCGSKLVEVTTTGVLFCSSHEAVCDYEFIPEIDGEF